MLTAPDPTIEGLIKFMDRAQPGLGLFSAEGGQFTGGHGMSQENRLKTAACLSALWDGTPVKRVRAMDGVTVHNGRRLALHVMIQRQAGAAFYSDPMLRDQGLLSRMLIAAPPSLAGTRVARAPDNRDDSAIRHYTGVIMSVFEQPLPLVAGTDNELAPPALLFSPEAAAAWRDFHDEIERQLGPHGRLEAVSDFAGKAPEHAARIAGVLAIIENPQAAELTAAHYARGVTLARWYCEESLRLAAASMTDPQVARAARLLDWWRDRSEYYDRLSLRTILQLGPSELRTKAAAESAVKVLAAHGWAIEASKRPARWSLANAGRTSGACYAATVATFATFPVHGTAGPPADPSSVANVATVAGRAAQNPFPGSPRVRFPQQRAEEATRRQAMVAALDGASKSLQVPSLQVPSYRSQRAQYTSRRLGDAIYTDCD
jgi:hypothetical protein